MKANNAIWVALAAIVLVIMGPFVTFVLRDLANAPDAENAAKVFDRWQTLLAGLLTLVGAAVAALLVVRQINTARNIEEERREARARALWICLGQELSDLAPYLTFCKNLLIRAHRVSQEREENQLVGAFKLEPAQNVPTLRNIIEIIAKLIEVGHKSEIKMLSEFAICVQNQRNELNVLIKALNGESSDIIVMKHVFQAIVDLAEINLFIGGVSYYSNSTKNIFPNINSREKVNKSIKSLFYEYEDREVIILNTCDIVAYRADRVYGKRQAYFDEGIVRAEQGAA